MGSDIWPGGSGGGGGGGTITTALPISGDGSSGNPVTTSLPVLNLDFNTWFAKQASFAKSLSASLTGFRTIRANGIGFNSVGAAVVSSSTFGADPKVEGGGFTTTTGTSQFWLENASQFQTPKTGTYFWVARVQFTAQSSTIAQKVGIGDGATGEISIESLSTVSTSHWSILVGGVNTVGTATLDASWHDLALFNDGTTIKSYVDGVLDASVAASTASANAAYGLFILSGSTSLAKVNIAAALLGYVSTSGL